MNEDKLLRLLRRIAAEDLDRELYSPSFWRFLDGTEKRESDVTEEDVASMEPRARQSWYQGIHRREMAKHGYILLEDGELKHIDALTLEDVPKFRSEYGERLKQYEAALKLLDFFSSGVQDLLQDPREIGFEMHSEDNETLKLWIRKRRV